MKLCYECVHMWVDPGSEGYSEYTPTKPMEMRCMKHHWEMDEHGLCKYTLKQILIMAETCPDYEADPEMVEIGGK